ncbi:polysaccharide deacetylase family protein [Candidatus Synechococcus calcipolaris G9]|uniref:Polysaccharide deacetylase family protein n=1 Tax=Candidatus Synechococcus calcipolaris G9 TaxID=1497997 RepID=A0ABT6EWB8_9SYNE|nr:polysaccharide deacetylase family protein [Candidatus Synechococcus calcipolaris]MDG2990076.1 polysaccharide deacetylase family protein [Candidatus Synechococcus calcipolaris G9]
MSLQAVANFTDQASPQAIAHQLNYIFAPQSTTVRLAFREDGWKILLEAEQVPDQNHCLVLLRQLLLQWVMPPEIHVYGRQAGQAPAWGVRLRPKPTPPSYLTPEIALPDTLAAPDTTAGQVAPPLEEEALDPRSLRDPFLLMSSLAVMVSGALGLLWTSPGYWLQRATAPDHDNVRALILDQADALKERIPAGVALGEYFPPQSLQGETIHQLALAPEQKLVALTFDDGPHPTHTPQVLEILQREKVKGTFFVVGQQVNQYPDLARQIVQRGHTIANHTWTHPTHPHSTEAAAAEINRSQALIQEVTGASSRLFRPPGGNLTNGLSARAAGTQYSVVMWSADPRDWVPGRSAQVITQEVLNQTKPGGIVLLHDGGGDRSQTVQALPAIIKGLRDKGYTLVTLPELFAAQDPSGAVQTPEWLSLQSIPELTQVRDQLQGKVDEQFHDLKTKALFVPEQRQNLADRYRLHKESLSWVQQRLDHETRSKENWLRALELGGQAAATGKGEDWERSQGQWQQAIAHLQHIPENAFIYSAAQLKLQEYQRNLNIVNRNLEVAQSQFLTTVAQEAGLSNQASIALCQVGGACRALRGDLVHKSTASLIKVPVAVVALHWAQHSQYGLDRPVFITSSNYTEDASTIRPRNQYPLQTLVEAMISHSSNIAPNQLMDIMGWDYINAVLKDYGLSRTQVGSKFMGDRIAPAKLGVKSNLSTSRDLTRLISQIYGGNVPGAQILQNALGKQKDRQLGYAALQDTQATWLGEKTGENAFVLGTSVIFRVKANTYVLTIIDQGKTGDAKLRHAIGAIAHHVIRHPQLLAT